MTKLIWLFLAGGLGVLARSGVNTLVERWHHGPFPLGTFIVNVLGCFAFGVIWALAETRQVISPDQRFILLTGFMGAFTTFSTFAFETSGLMRESQWLMAVGNALGQTALGLVAVILGIALGRAF